MIKNMAKVTQSWWFFWRLECRSPWCWTIDSTIPSSFMQCFPDRHQLYTLHTRKGCLYCIKHMETPFHCSDRLATSVWMNRSSYSQTTRSTEVCRVILPSRHSGSSGVFFVLLLLKREDREWAGGDELCGELEIGKYLDQGRKYNICHHVSLKIHQCSARRAISGGFDLTMDVCTLR